MFTGSDGSAGSPISFHVACRATCLSAAVASSFVGWFANLPFGLAAGMGSAVRQRPVQWLPLPLPLRLPLRLPLPLPLPLSLFLSLFLSLSPSLFLSSSFPLSLSPSPSPLPSPPPE